MISPDFSLIQNIDIPRSAPPSAQSKAGADTLDASFAQTLKERSQRPDQADSTDDGSKAPDSTPDSQTDETLSVDEAQRETTESADLAQNEPAVTDDVDGSDDSVAGEQLVPDKTFKESPAQPSALNIDAPQAVQVEAVKPVSSSSSSSSASLVSLETLSVPRSGAQQLTTSQSPSGTPELVEGQSKVPLTAIESSTAKNVDATGAPASVDVQPVKTNAVSPVTAEPTATVASVSTDSVDVPDPVNTVKTQPALVAEAQDKPKADQAQHTPSSSDDGQPSLAGGRVSAAEGAQSNPNSTFQEGQPRQAEPVLRSAERTTLTQSEPEAPSASQRLFNATVSRGLEAAMRQKGGSITIRLNPDSLGSLRIELQISQGEVTAQFHATTQKARDLLHENMSSLRTSLEAKGFGVKSVDVQVQASSPSDPSSGEFERSSEDDAGQTPTQDSGANGQALSRQEDPDDFPYLNQTVDPLTEVEPIDAGWQTVRAGGVNTIA